MLFLVQTNISLTEPLISKGPHYNPKGGAFNFLLEKIDSSVNAIFCPLFFYYYRYTYLTETALGINN